MEQYFIRIFFPESNHKEISLLKLEKCHEEENVIRYNVSQFTSTIDHLSYPLIFQKSEEYVLFKTDSLIAVLNRSASWKGYIVEIPQYLFEGLEMIFRNLQNAFQIAFDYHDFDDSTDITPFLIKNVEILSNKQCIFDSTAMYVFDKESDISIDSIVGTLQEKEERAYQRAVEKWYNE